MKQDKVTNRLLEKSGMFDKIFWNLLNKIVYREDIEDDKNTLKQLYWFTDVDDVFPSKIDKRYFDKLNNVINDYKESLNPDSSQNE